jgi:tetratricopeptide (TPR) repeat protein
MRYTALGIALMLANSACDMVEVYQAQIDRGTRAIEAAASDAARAAAYADRGRAYSNKARLSMLRQRIDRDEYVRLFELAIRDHDRAVALASADANIYLQRGLTHYDRAAQVEGVDSDRTPWFDAARADFSTAVEKDPRQAMANDYLGLVDEQTGRIDEAIADYTRVMALDPRRGRSRLAELHCNRGQAHLQEKRFDLAAVELEKSVELAVAADGCSCEPFNALAYVYVDATGQYDKGWDLVRRARSSGHAIARDYVERLEKATGKRG